MPKTTKRLHDLDSLSLGGAAKFPHGYNVQAGVDADNQIIVAADLHLNQSDQGALIPMLDQIEKNCGKQANNILGDCGYNSLKNLKEVAKRGANAIISVEPEYHDVPIRKSEQIRKGDGERTYHCLGGRELFLASRGKSGLVFKKSPRFCAGCTQKNKCKIETNKNFSILDDEDRIFFNLHLEKCRSECFQEKYKFRKAIVEPVFGNIKNKGLRIYHRGNRSVRTWWLLACSAHNVEKIVKTQLKST